MNDNTNDISPAVTLLRNARLMCPEDRGVGNVLLVHSRIHHVSSESFDPPTGMGPVEDIDLAGDYLIPGLIDGHVHFLGGGGEGGPATRTPEITLTALTGAGVTSAVGVLGTDGTTRTLPALLTKARALEEEGITTRTYTGAYQLPTPTVTGSVRDDIMLIDRVVGAKVAVSDHRSSQPGVRDLRFLASECRVGGMLGGKPGLMHVHVGPGESGLEPLFRVIRESGIPPHHIYPTHVGRSRGLLEAAAEFTRLGSPVDVTAGEDAAERVFYLLEQDARPERVTITSDGNGSKPLFDEGGNFIGLGIGSPDTLLQTLRGLVEHGVDLEVALAFFTRNPARILGLEGRGRIAAGAAADLVCLTRTDMEVRHVWANGRQMVKDARPIVFGTFER
ncbi:MAG: beta-aspartyl-peptidase [Clostridia bacterium]